MDMRHPQLSVVVPFFDEEESIQKVCEELREILAAERGLTWELLMVDDGSKDRSPRIMDDLAVRHENFHALHLEPHSGQSAALEAGIGAGLGEFIATLDGDGQNDPRDIPRLLNLLKVRGSDMICGIRHKRADNLMRRISSRIANRVRSAVLKDNITDVGCSLRVFRRDCMKRIRFFRNAHRFLPALFIMAGFSVFETPVSHRPRQLGKSKYGGGINSRLWAGIADLAGVFWLRKRTLRYTVTRK